MALARWTATAQDAEGNAVAGCSIEVRSDETGRLVQVYADRAGTVALGNPFVAPEATFGFHVEGGAYKITATKGAFQSIWRYVAIGTASEFDYDQFIYELQAGLMPVATFAEIDGQAPGVDQSLAAIVLADPDPTRNGYYLWSEGAGQWQRKRPLPDTLARLTVVGGTANALEALASTGVDPGAVLAFFVDVPTANTGPVMLSINGGPALPVLDVAGAQFPAGTFVGRVFLTRDETSFRALVQSIKIEIGSVAEVPFGTTPGVTSNHVLGGYSFNFSLPAAPTLALGPVTTLPPGSSSDADLVPVPGGYRLDLSLVRGLTGDMTGVTPFWQSRITVDLTREKALEGITGTRTRLGTLGVTYHDGDDIPPEADFYNPPGAGAAGYFGGYWPLLRQIRTPARGWDLNGSQNSLAFRNLHDTWSDWKEFWHTGNTPLVSESDAAAGVITAPRTWSPLRVAQAIGSLAWLGQPIGVPIPLWSHLDGVPEPPIDNPGYRYIKLTASDSYNSQALSGESVSGAAPLIQATAVISDAASPLNGQIVRLINTERRFLRAGAVGSVENDQLQAMTGEASITAGGGMGLVSSGDGVFAASGGPNNETGSLSGTATRRRALSFDSSRVARSGDDTRPKNIGVDYYMRIR